MVDHARSGDWSAYAAVDDLDDLENLLATMEPSTHAIADMDRARGLGGIAVDTNVSAMTTVRRLGSRLVDANRPEKAVDSRCLHISIVARREGAAVH